MALIMLLCAATLSSCSNDDENASGNLRIDSVSTALQDSLTTTGYVDNTYIIRGSGFLGMQKITFNDVQADFNPTLVTDKVIIVTIPTDAPFMTSATSNKIRIETKNSFAEYDFIIGQPAPTITSFDPLAGGPGTVVTIKGTVFDNLIGVRFDDIEAEVVSSTPTQIKVLVPEGIVQAKIFVETTGGIAESAGQFGFRFIVYDDILASGWWVGGWGGTQEFNSTTVVKRGTYSIHRTTEGWSGFQIGNGGAPINLSDGFTAVKVSIYAVNSGNVMLVLNGNYGQGKLLTLTAGQWVDFTVPLSELGAPATLNEIVIQEFSGAANEYYFDDLGMI